MLRSRKFSKISLFDLTQFSRNKLVCSPKYVQFTLYIFYTCRSYIVLALISAVTNLPNITLIFHDFQGMKIKIHTFPGLENEILKISCISRFFMTRANPVIGYREIYL